MECLEVFRYAVKPKYVWPAGLRLLLSLSIRPVQLLLESGTCGDFVSRVGFNPTFARSFSLNLINSHNLHLRAEHRKKIKYTRWFVRLVLGDAIEIHTCFRLDWIFVSVLFVTFIFTENIEFFFFFFVCSPCILYCFSSAFVLRFSFYQPFGAPTKKKQRCSNPRFCLAYFHTVLYTFISLLTLIFRGVILGTLVHIAPPI